MMQSTLQLLRKAERQDIQDINILWPAATLSLVPIRGLNMIVVDFELLISKTAVLGKIVKPPCRLFGFL